MKATKEKIELEDYEIEEIIACIKYTRDDTMWFHTAEDYDNVSKMYDNILFKLKNMLIITNKNEK